MAESEVKDICNFNSPVRKKLKTSDKNTKTENSIHTSLKTLEDFKVEKFLHNNTNRKTICIQGTFADSEGSAIVLLEKTAFTEDSFEKKGGYLSAKNPLKNIFHNDIYGKYEFYPEIGFNTLKATVIHPATDKHIQKYSTVTGYIINETPLIYQNITLPYINGEQFDLKWVYNILEHKSEADRIIVEDEDPETGFIIVPDLKWDGSLITLYFLAIVRLHDLKSIRDLTDKHLPLLRNIQEKGTAAIKEKYNLDASQLRIYLHYQPSFYHLHVHFTNLKHDAPGITAERCHLLSNVISNIELLPDYYQKITLPFVVRESDKLFNKLVENGLLTKVQNV